MLSKDVILCNMVCKHIANSVFAFCEISAIYIKNITREKLTHISFLFFILAVSTCGEVPAVTMESQVKQPQGRGLSSLFSCCFKGSNQPEITYCHDNISNVAVLEPTLPLPPLYELDSMFTELVVSKRPESGFLF